MSDEKIQYVSAQRLDELQQELSDLKNIKIPEIATHIDEAKQQGDLSENAEYHQAKEEMAWAQGRRQELEYLLDHVQIVAAASQKQDAVIIGSTIVIKTQDKTKTYFIVGPQEADPLHGKISNESPLGEAFMGHRVGDQLVVHTPGGKQRYEILEVR